EPSTLLTRLLLLPGCPLGFQFANHRFGFRGLVPPVVALAAAFLLVPGDVSSLHRVLLVCGVSVTILVVRCARSLGRSWPSSRMPSCLSAGSPGLPLAASVIVMLC